MSLPESFLRVARDLATIDPYRPRQAALRRAVSTGYYALFHLLVAAAARRMYPSDGDRRLRIVAARTFAHTAVRRLAGAVLAPPTARPADVAELLGPEPPSAALVSLCRAFLVAHGPREEADYDLAAHLRRSDALALLDQIGAAFADWTTLRNTPEGQRFTLALLLLGRPRRGT